MLKYNFSSHLIFFSITKTPLQGFIETGYLGGLKEEQTYSILKSEEDYKEYFRLIYKIKQLN